MFENERLRSMLAMAPTKTGKGEKKGDKGFSFPFLGEQNQTVPSREACLPGWQCLPGVFSGALNGLRMPLPVCEDIIKTERSLRRHSPLPPPILIIVLGSLDRTFGNLSFLHMGLVRRPAGP